MPNAADYTFEGVTYKVFRGTPGDDVIIGTDASDYLIGNGGNDTICARGSKDMVAYDTRNNRLPVMIDAGYGDDRRRIRALRPLASARRPPTSAPLPTTPSTPAKESQFRARRSERLRGV
jgi:hypothetical protein